MIKLFGLWAIVLMANHASAITNSNPALDAHYNSLVWIQTAALQDDGDRGIAFCNATLLNDRVLVTAAHCLAHTQVLNSHVIGLKIGRYYSITRPDGRVVRIGWKAFLELKDEPAQFLLPSSLKEKIRRDGAKAKIDISEDYALIILQNRIDLEAQQITPLKTVPAALIPRLRQLSTLSPIVSSINLISESTTDFRRVGQLNSVSLNGTVIESKSVARVEPGDSGAPVTVTIDGKRYIAGVTKGRAESLFSNWDGFAALDQRLCNLARTNGQNCDF